ncbi:MAG: hypothetical protein NT003_00065 [Candidatus Magasanikbacteria bacterium]|nr:hypothetical protein [Candidatus Magasanikbacteria bacterium]
MSTESLRYVLRIVWRIVDLFISLIDLGLMIASAVIWILLHLVNRPFWNADIMLEDSLGPPQIFDKGRLRGRVYEQKMWLTNEDLHRITVHEAAHAVVLLHSPRIKRVILNIRIRRWRGRNRLLCAKNADGTFEIGGIVSDDELFRDRQAVIDYCSMLYAGGIAIHGSHSFARFTSAKSDCAKANACIRKFVRSRFWCPSPIRMMIYTWWIQAQAKSRSDEIICRERQAINALADHLKKHLGQVVEGAVVMDVVMTASVERVELPF